MAKKSARHTKKVRRHHHKAKPTNDMLVAVQGWMFVVVFALMLGIGAIVGTFFNRMMNESSPTVAGAQTEFVR